jgi:hypothetical protein
MLLLLKIPDAAGTSIPSLNLSDDEITLPVITWENPIESANLSAIVFAQLDSDNGINDVLQAAIVDIDFNILTALGENIENKNILIYPNPTSDILNVVFSTDEQKTVRVFDQFGKMVYDIDLQNGVKSHQIETTRFASGVYFLQIESVENELIREKFILSH